MAQNKTVVLGPVALTATLTTNIFSPPTLTGGTGVPENSTNSYYIIKHIRVVNKTAAAHNFSLWKGASAGNVAGTEVVGQGLVVPANSSFDWYGYMRLAAGDTNLFLVGGADAGSALTLEAEAEMGIV